MKLLRIFILLISVLLVFSCSDNNSTDPDSTNTEPYYPLKVGNSWTFNANNNGTPYSQTIDIDQSLLLSNGKTAYHMSEDDDYSFGGYRLYYEGSKFYIFVNDSAIEIFDESSFSSNTETLVVPAGQFEAYKFEWRSWWDNSDIYIYWLARGVGPVKIDDGDGDVRELASYSIK